MEHEDIGHEKPERPILTLIAGNVTIKFAPELKPPPTEAEAAILQLEIDQHNRKHALDKLCAIAVYYTNHVKFGVSLPIPLGKLPLDQSEGNDAAPTLYAIVRNTYDTGINLEHSDTSAVLSPDKIWVDLWVSTEPSDLSPGIDFEPSSLVASKVYEKGRVPRLNSPNDSGDTALSDVLLSPDQCTQQQAELQSQAIHAELTDLNHTLHVLRGGIRFINPEAAKHLAAITRDVYLY